MQFIEAETLVAAIVAANAQREAFSFIRLSHCETRLMGFGRRFDRADVMHSIRHQWGKVEPESADLLEVSRRIIAAFRTADVIALNDRDRPDGQPSLIEFERHGHELAHELGLLDGRPVARVSVHWALAASPDFRRLLAAQDRIIIVTSRDVGPRLARWLEGPEVIRIDVPAHASQRFDAAEAERHFPEGLTRALDALAACNPQGTIVLVGAGLLGKIICGEARDMGGIAIDVGSLFDAWQGLRTRRTMPEGLTLPAASN